MFMLKELGATIMEAAAPTLVDFAKSYLSKGDVDDTSWASKKFEEHIPGISSEEATGLSDGLISGVDNFNARMASLQAARNAGRERSEWLKDVLEKEKGKSIVEQGDELQAAYNSLSAGNLVMRQAMESPNETLEISEDDLLNAGNAGEPTEWNKYNARKLINNLNKQAEMTGMHGMSLPDVIDMNDMTGQDQETLPVEEAENDGAMDRGLKIAAGAALKALKCLSVTKKIPLLNKLPIGTFADIACWGVEGARCIGRLANGKMTTMQALEHMKCASTVVVANAVTAAAPLALAAIPVVGVPLATVTSVVMATEIGNVVQEKVKQGIDILADAAKELLPPLDGVKEFASGIKNSVLNFLNA